MKGIAYGPSKKCNREVREAERKARKQGLGIWGDPELTQKYLRLTSKWGQTASQAKQ
jgi:endonuclease YncB( thermonuclease family)